MQKKISKRNKILVLEHLIDILSRLCTPNWTLDLSQCLLQKKNESQENLLSCRSRYCSWDDMFANPIAYFFFSIWKEGKKLSVINLYRGEMLLSTPYSFTSSLKEVSLFCPTPGPTKWSSHEFHWVCRTVNLFWHVAWSFLKCCKLIDRNDLAFIIFS